MRRVNPGIRDVTRREASKKPIGGRRTSVAVVDWACVLVCLRVSLWWDLCERQREVEHRSPAELAGRVDFSSVELDNGFCNRQPHSRSLDEHALVTIITEPGIGYRFDPGY